MHEVYWEDTQESPLEQEAADVRGRPGPPQAPEAPCSWGSHGRQAHPPGKVQSRGRGQGSSCEQECRHWLQVWAQPRW